MNIDTLNVLVVDDSKTMLRIITNVLKRLGISNFSTGLDGVEGLELFKNDNFDLVLSDINMPNMNGIELLKEIRKLNKDVPIVMITTEGGKTSVIEALKAGCNQYIVKPFTPDILKGKLQNIIY